MTLITYSQDISHLWARFEQIFVRCHLYENPRIDIQSVNLCDLNLSVKYLLSDRVCRASELVKNQLKQKEKEADFSSFEFGLDEFTYSTPVVVEKSPHGFFCLDGSHRLYALRHERVSKVRLIVITDVKPTPPPAELFALNEVEVLDTVEHWHDRFSNFRHEYFRNIAGQIDAMVIPVSQVITKSDNGLETSK